MTTRRRGYALIEVLVVLTVAAILLTLCAGMVHLLLKLDRAGRAASEEATDLARLARDFRADAHASAPLGPPARGADRMSFAIEVGKTVEYQVRPRDLLRTLREGDEVRRHELYRRPPRASIRFEVAGEGPRPLATIIVDRPLDGREGSLYRDYRIEAELGRDRRITSRAE